MLARGGGLYVYTDDDIDTMMSAVDVTLAPWQRIFLKTILNHPEIDFRLAS